MNHAILTIFLAFGALLTSADAQKDQKKASAAPGKDFKTGRIKGPVGQLYYDDGGQGGIPVVFVHSFGGSTDHWKSQLKYFRKDRRVIALDLRAHGRSDAPKTMDYGVPSLADDISAVVDSLGLKRFVLVGHSMGGAAAVAYAGQHPERVAGLVMSGTPGKSSEEQSKPIIASLESDQYDKVMRDYTDKMLKNATPAVDSMERAGMKRFSKSTNLAIIKSIFEYDPLIALKKYPGPKLIIGTDAEEQPGSLHTQMTDVPYKTINGTSHWTQLDKPDDFNRILAEFLASIDAKK